MSELNIQMLCALALVKVTYLIIMNGIQYKWNKCSISGIKIDLAHMCSKSILGAFNSVMSLAQTFYSGSVPSWNGIR